MAAASAVLSIFGALGSLSGAGLATSSAGTVAKLGKGGPSKGAGIAAEAGGMSGGLNLAVGVMAGPQTSAINMYVLISSWMSILKTNKITTQAYKKNLRTLLKLALHLDMLETPYTRLFTD